MMATTDGRNLHLRVVRRTVGAEDVVVLDLAEHNGAELPEWSPGAHIDLVLPGGTARQYSLCGDPQDTTVWRIGVLLEPHGRGGSRYVHEELTEGREVEVRGPRNHFELLPAARYVFIAGGIGITPILPMVESADRSGCQWELHYGGRRLRSMAFVDDLNGRKENRVHLYPEDQAGLIDLGRILDRPRSGTLVYCCGPEPLLDAVEERCATWPPGALRVERFAAKDTDEPRTGHSSGVDAVSSVPGDMFSLCGPRCSPARSPTTPR